MKCWTPIVLLACGVAGTQATLDAVQVGFRHMTGVVYPLQASGGNKAAPVGKDGIVRVDGEFAPLAAEIATALKGIGATGIPVRFVINTQFHGDHAAGSR